MEPCEPRACWFIRSRMMQKAPWCLAAPRPLENWIEHHPKDPRSFLSAPASAVSAPWCCSCQPHAAWEVLGPSASSASILPHSPPLPPPLSPSLAPQPPVPRHLIPAASPVPAGLQGGELHCPRGVKPEASVDGSPPLPCDKYILLAMEGSGMPRLLMRGVLRYERAPLCARRRTCGAR